MHKDIHFMALLKKGKFGLLLIILLKSLLLLKRFRTQTEIIKSELKKI